MSAGLPTLPTQRFSNRVADYVKYRPGYPAAVLEGLRADGILAGGAAETRVADVGSGTGLLATVFLEAGHAVWGVEPNAEMRRAGEIFLARFPTFHSVTGTAEATTLASGSVDLVTAGQAFHWFDRAAARREFARILRPPGWVALIWNERRTDSSAFLAGYEKLLHDFSTDYAAVDHRRMTEEHFREFFSPAGYAVRRYANQQVFDYAGLKGRLLSSSYAPVAGDARHGPMMAALEKLFAEHEQEGRVVFEYVTEVYAGRVG